MNPETLRIGLIGTGNLSWALTAALRDRGIPVTQTIGRRAETAADYTAAFGLPVSLDLRSLRQDLDLLLILTPDAGIPDVVAQLVQTGTGTACVAHCSGSVSLEMLAPLGARTGVMWPLQSFTKGQSPDWSQIPVLLEAADPACAPVLETVARNLSQRVLWTDSAARRELHLGAVFASNFPNFLLSLAAEIAAGHKLPPDLYGPLATETVRKAFSIGPAAAQTGPARRGDLATLQRHIELLGDTRPEFRELYEVLSRMIRSRYADS